MHNASPYRPLAGWRHALLCVATLLLLAAPVAAQEMATPDPTLSARDVVKLQLNALARNDAPTEDAGIEQVWAFAHPDNRAMTGPLPRFTRMIHGANYTHLIDHRRHEIEALETSDDNAVFAVRVLARDGNLYRFIWQVRPAETEAGRTWMTTQVTPSQATGEQMTRLEGPQEAILNLT